MYNRNYNKTLFDYHPGIEEVGYAAKLPYGSQAERWYSSKS
jgi:hypothetical protein